MEACSETMHSYIFIQTHACMHDHIVPYCESAALANQLSLESCLASRPNSMEDLISITNMAR